MSVDVHLIDCAKGTVQPATDATVQEQLSLTDDTVLSRPVTRFDLDCARKLTTGQRAFFFFGFNDDVDAGWEDIHATGGDIAWQTAPVTLEVSSSNTNDTNTGDEAGLRSVEIHGLSALGVDQDEVVKMNGTTVVTTAKKYIRVNSMHNEEVGTYGGSHRGDITLTVVSAGATLATMTGREGNVNDNAQYGSGESGLAHFSVPKGKVMYITDLYVSMNVKTMSQTVDVILYEREGILDSTSAPFLPRRIIWSAIEINNPISKAFKSHIKIKELTDIWFRAQSSGTNSKIACSLDFYLIDRNSEGA